VSIGKFFKAHLKFFVGVVLLMLAGALAIGGLVYYRHQQFMEPIRAFQALQLALSAGDKIGLAGLADFRSLSGDFVRAALAVYQQPAVNEEQQVEMQDDAQRQTLKVLAGKKPAKSEDAKQRKPFTPVPPVPVDVVAQIAAGLKMEVTPEEPDILRAMGPKLEAALRDVIALLAAGLRRDAPPEEILARLAAEWRDVSAQIAAGLTSETMPGGMQLRSQFTHKGLQAEFPVRLLMERRNGVWVVTRLLNAQELLNRYKEAAAALRAGDIAVRTDENEKIRARMHAHFYEPQCLASVNLLSGKRDAVLVVKVTASNTDTTPMLHVNLLCEVRAGNGKPVLLSRQLNVARRVNGGGSFANTWTVVLDANSEEAVRLLQAGPLSCTVEPKSLGVGGGEILYPRKFE